jgi:uncharacterized protein (DUF1697 family)
MPKYVAFLRGINAGRVIKMIDLKDCFESMGLDNVKTVLQTGNVVFESNKNVQDLKRLIEKEMSIRFSFDAKAQVYSFEDLSKIIEAYSFEDKEGMHSYVIFLENSLEQDLVKEEYKLSDDEKVKAGKGVVYWQVCRGDTLSSLFAKLLAKSKYKLFNTNRNLNTLKKIINA